MLLYIIRVLTEMLREFIQFSNKIDEGLMKAFQVDVDELEKNSKKEIQNLNKTKNSS